MPLQTRLIFSLVVGLTFIPIQAQAATAPWYKWQGATRVICKQWVNPKSAFKLIDGPYRDASCRYRGRPS
jgi:hypothetical protein